MLGLGLDVLDGGREVAGPNSAGDGEGDGAADGSCEGDPPAHAVPLEVPLPFEGIEVLGYGQGSADANVCGDLPQGWGVAVIVQVGSYILQHLTLARGEVISIAGLVGSHRTTIPKIRKPCQGALESPR